MAKNPKKLEKSFLKSAKKSWKEEHQFLKSLGVQGSRRGSDLSFFNVVGYLLFPFRLLRGITLIPKTVLSVIFVIGIVPILSLAPSFFAISHGANNNKIILDQLIANLTAKSGTSVYLKTSSGSGIGGAIFPSILGSKDVLNTLSADAYVRNFWSYLFPNSSAVIPASDEFTILKNSQLALSAQLFEHNNVLGDNQHFATKVLLLSEEHRADFQDNFWDFSFQGIRPIRLIGAMTKGVTSGSGRGGSNVAMQISENIRFKPFPYGKSPLPPEAKTEDQSHYQNRPVCFLFLCSEKKYQGILSKAHNLLTQKQVEFSDAAAIHAALYDADGQNVWDRYARISSMYFQSVPFVGGISGSPHGIRTASWAVFNKKPDRLSEAELLLLIGGAIRRPISAKQISNDNLARAYWKYEGWIDTPRGDECGQAIGIRYFADVAYRRVLKRLIVGSDQDLQNYAPFPVRGPTTVIGPTESQTRRTISKECKENSNKFITQYMSSLPNKAHQSCSQDAEAVLWRGRYGFGGQNGCFELLELEKELIELVQRYSNPAESPHGQRFTRLPTIADAKFCGELNLVSARTLSNPNQTFNTVFSTETRSIIDDLEAIQQFEFDRHSKDIGISKVTDAWIGLPMNHIQTRCAVKRIFEDFFEGEGVADFSSNENSSVEVVLHVTDLEGNTVFEFQNSGIDGPKLDKHINLASVSKIWAIHYLVKTLCLDQESCEALMSPGGITPTVPTSLINVIASSNTSQLIEIIKASVDRTGGYRSVDDFVTSIGHPYYAGKINNGNIGKYFSSGQAIWLKDFESPSNGLEGTTVEKHQAYMLQIGRRILDQRGIFDRTEDFECPALGMPRNITRYNLPNQRDNWRNPIDANVFCGRNSNILQDSSWFSFSPEQVATFRQLLEAPLSGTARLLNNQSNPRVIGVKTGTLEWGWDNSTLNYSNKNRVRLLSGFFEKNNKRYAFTFYVGFIVKQGEGNSRKPHLGSFGISEWRELLGVISEGISK